jgi:hypothetical protein
MGGGGGVAVAALFLDATTGSCCSSIRRRGARPLRRPRTVWIRWRSAWIGPRRSRIESTASVNVERAEELAIDRTGPHFRHI